MNDNRLRLVDEDRPPSTPPADPLIGRTLDGRYRIEDVLGEGGMGIVYRARHVVLNKSLAIKVLRHDVSKDADVMGRFRQEAQSASAIGNQHIIDISDFGTLPDGSTYFVMEYLDGKSLTQVIESAGQGTPSERLIHVAKQLCEALHAAHSQNIIHRDLKPDNIYLVRRGDDLDFVKVLDFGIAKVGGATSKLTKAGQVFGTPHYMSPEQCAGHAIDHRSDIYSIGVILYEMATGKVPFDSDTLMGILTKHIYERPVPPRESNPSLLPALEQVIMRCLAKEPEHRYASMADAREDLERARLGLLPVSLAPSAPVTHTQRPTPQNRNMLFAGASLLVVGVAVFLGMWMLSENDAEHGRTVPLTQTIPTTAGTNTAANPALAIPAPVTQIANDTVPAAVQSPTIHVESTPPGAEVYVNDLLIGNAPVDVDRPHGDATSVVILRLQGHADATRRIAEATQDIMVTLEAERHQPRVNTPPRTTPRTSAPQTNTDLIEPEW